MLCAFCAQSPSVPALETAPVYSVSVTVRDGEMCTQNSSTACENNKTKQKYAVCSTRKNCRGIKTVTLVFHSSYTLDTDIDIWPF